MTDATLSALVMCVTSLPLFAIAYYVRQGRLHLFNGLDASRVTDPVALARVLSLELALMGGALAVAGAAIAWAGGDEARTRLVVAVLVGAITVLILVMLRTLVRARANYRPDTTRRG